MSMTSTTRNPKEKIWTASGRSSEEISALIGQIYDTVVNPQSWPKVVGAIAKSMNAERGLLFTPYMRPQKGGCLFPWKIEQSSLQLWGSKYIDHDIWAKSILEKNLWQEGAVLLDEELVPRELLKQSTFYREFLSTMDIGRVCTGLILGGAPGLPETNLSLFKAFDSPAFSDADVAWLRLLIPHLSRALGLLHRLGALHVHNESLLAAFESMDFGVCLLGEVGQVLFENPSARHVFSRNDGLSLDDQNCLVGSSNIKFSAGSPNRLKDWISDQMALPSSNSAEAAHFSNAFLQMRTEPAKRYALQCSLLPASPERIGHATARMAVFITDPDAVKLPPIKRLVDLYGLTISQARVARALAGGSSQKEIARDLDVSVSTIAAHVSEVYARVKVNRQGDLIRHILVLAKATV